MHVALPPESPLARRRVITPKDLHDRPMITLNEHHQSTLKLRDAFRAEGARCRAVIETHLFPSAISLVNAGLGHALVDPVSADSFLKRRDCRVTVVPFEPAIDLEIALITSRFHPPSRHCQRFLPYLEAGLEAWQQHSRQPLMGKREAQTSSVAISPPPITISVTKAMRRMASGESRGGQRRPA